MARGRNIGAPPSVLRLLRPRKVILMIKRTLALAAGVVILAGIAIFGVQQLRLASLPNAQYPSSVPLAPIVHASATPSPQEDSSDSADDRSGSAEARKFVVQDVSFGS